MRTRYAPCAVLALVYALQQGWAADPPPPTLELTVSNRVKTVTWPRPLLPALETNQLYTAEQVTNFTPITASNLVASPAGYIYLTSNNLPSQFFNLQMIQKSSNALLVANVLNRVAYGPTPDELERVAAMGPQAYLEEQLNVQALPEPMDVTPPQNLHTTNSVPPELWIKTNWVQVEKSGTNSGANFYLYLTAAGEAYVDDIALYAGTGTNVNRATNYIRNGGFESPWAGTWTVSSNHANSSISPEVWSSGQGSLHVVATTGGSTQGSSIWQPLAPGLTNGQPCTLSYWYLPRTNSTLLTLRLSGSGITSAPLTNEPAYFTPTWVYVALTGRATGTNLYVYLEDSGTAYLDDMKLVAGTVPEAGPNLLRNGDFESSFPGPYWGLSPNCLNSAVTPLVAHGGASSLRLAFTAAGSTLESAVVQTNLTLTLNSSYSLSFWYVQSARTRLVARLSGSGIRAEPDRTPAGLYLRLSNLSESSVLSDLRAWFCRHAVEGNRQLLEVLSQFWENHFVTYHGKTVDFLDRYYDEFGLMDRLAANLEFREIERWRNAMLNPACTFHDLLKISAESPAQIIYLDTVDSRGDANNIANENYARELFELYTMGVDNGYDQSDIVAMSRAWTGWRLRLVNYGNERNPFAPQSTTRRVPSGNASISNLVGTWSFVFDPARHGTNRAPILSEWDPASPPTSPRATGSKRVPARFGPRWAGQSYQLTIPPRRTGETNGIQDGYDVIRHLADLPMTMEYISIKLCRLLVHDGFPNPTTKTNLPEYAFYDYGRPDLSPEARLVYDCMVAWDSSTPRGQLRPVLRTIFNSALFRSHGGSMQKIKTPLEFCVSAVRALRSVNPDGTATASTDGYAIRDPISRMGQMSLFNRADPDGYPEFGAAWISAGTLAERLKWVQSFCTVSGAGAHGRAFTVNGRSVTINDAGNSVCDPVALLKKKLPSNLWNSDGAVADYFLAILFPGEGAANLDLYRASAVGFLNMADDGTTASAFRSLGNTGTTYRDRVRGMVSLLMTTQRFQEQ